MTSDPVSPNRWRALFALRVGPDELASLSTHASPLVSITDYGFAYFEDAPDVTVFVDVRETSEDDAEATADFIFTEWLREAGISEDLGRRVAIAPFTEPPADYFLRRAHGLLVGHEYEASLVLVGTACEIHVRQTMRRLLADKLGSDDAAAAIQITSHLTHDRTRALFRALTGSDPKTETWWSKYSDTVRHRNAVVHEGFPVTASQASVALGVLQELGNYLERHS